MLSVETDLAGRVLDGSRQEIIELLENAGYTRFDHRKNINAVTGVAQDDLFVRNDVVKKYEGIGDNWENKTEL